MSLDFLSHLRRESDRFLDVLAEADPSARVPSCPEWAAADLLWHLAEVQWFWATIVEERRTGTEGIEHPERPTDRDALLTFAAQQSDRLVRVLTETAPETEVYMWAEDKTVGYIRRRQAHEALIHRLDAELTVGAVTPLDADLAADGVDECLAIMYGGIPEDWGTFTPTAAPVRVHLTDRPDADTAVQPGRFVGTDPDGRHGVRRGQRWGWSPTPRSPRRSAAPPTTSTPGSGTAAATRRSRSTATPARWTPCGPSCAARSPDRQARDSRPSGTSAGVPGITATKSRAAERT